MNSGAEHHLPYSFSRYTDVTGDPSKLRWFEERLRDGSFLGIDPRTGVPVTWDLTPSGVQSFDLWTKDPGRLQGLYRSYLKDFRNFCLHLTVTGWGGTALERNVPTGEDVFYSLGWVDGAFPITWRISPVPHNLSILDFIPLFRAAQAVGVTQVFLSFMQYGRVPELDPVGKQAWYDALAELAQRYKIPLFLCADDKDVLGSVGICAPKTHPETPARPCGCALAVDPFGVGESCSLGCSYCYVSDEGVNRGRRHSSLYQINKRGGI